MSLFKQITLLITALLFLVLAVVFAINFNASKSFVQNELYQQTKNTVNTLSLSISHVSDDLFLMETAITAMFDGGHFQRITLKDPDGRTLVQRNQALTIQGIPQTFIRTFSMEAPVAEAVVTNDWNIVGSLEIQGHTGAVYIRIWEILKDLTLAFFLVWAGCTLLGILLLRLLLSPLEQIRRQAESVEKNQFIITPDIPSTPELKQVVIQMNKMVQTVGDNYKRSLETIRKIRQLQYVDPESQLYNKAYFVKQIQAHMDSESALSTGSIALLQVRGMDRIKTGQGYDVYRDWIRRIATRLTAEFQSMDGAFTARLNPCEFAMVLPNHTPEAVRPTLANLMAKLEKVEGDMPPGPQPPTFPLTVTPYAFGRPPSQLLSNLDLGLAQAKAQSGSAPLLFDPRSVAPMERREWKTLLEATLASHGFHLSTQPVQDKKGRPLHQEIYVSMETPEQPVLAAGIFMPMAVDLGLAGRIDGYIIRKAAGLATRQAELRLGINVSADFIRNRETMGWFRQFLKKNKTLAYRLVFEISENTLVHFPEPVADFTDMVRAFGFQFGIDNFTLTDASLSLLQPLSPSYIKVDHFHVSDPQGTGASDITLNALLNITQSLNTQLIGCRIETQEQFDAMQRAGIRYFQGNHIAPGRRLNPNDR